MGVEWFLGGGGMGRICLWKSLGLVLTARCASVVKTALAQVSAFSPRVVPNAARCKFADGIL
jgi:hypothetical protein